MQRSYGGEDRSSPIIHKNIADASMGRYGSHDGGCFQDKFTKPGF